MEELMRVYITLLTYSQGHPSPASLFLFPRMCGTFSYWNKARRPSPSGIAACEQYSGRMSIVSMGCDGTEGSYSPLRETIEKQSQAHYLSFEHSHPNSAVLHALGKPPVGPTCERRSGFTNVVDTWSGRVTSPHSPLTSIYVSQPKVASRTRNSAYAVRKQTSTSKPRVGLKRARNERG
jgi:hypothetical protein